MLARREFKISLGFRCALRLGISLLDRSYAIVVTSSTQLTLFRLVAVLFGWSLLSCFTTSQVPFILAHGPHDRCNCLVAQPSSLE